MKRGKRPKGVEMGQRQSDGTISNGEIMKALLGDEPDVSASSRVLAKKLGFSDAEVDLMYGPKVKE